MVWLDKLHAARTASWMVKQRLAVFLWVWWPWLLLALAIIILITALSNTAS